MSNEEKLRALLARAREVVQGVLRAADSTPYAQWSRDQHQAEIVRDAIDAALAEPPEPPESEYAMHARIRADYDKTVADCWRAKVAEIERERDEARAEVEYAYREDGALYEAKIAQSEAEQERDIAFQRGAEAMREAAAEWFTGDIERAAAGAHEAYQREAHRRGDVRHADAYADLSEATKEWDRVLCRWVAGEVRALPLPEDK